jgi:metal-sulfur cluster biosynthetic enzyme
MPLLPSLQVDFCRPSPLTAPQISTHTTQANQTTSTPHLSQHIRDITDPEHPYTLEQLNVVSEDAIDVDDATGKVQVRFTPTVEHCSMATLIGLCIRVKLLRALPPRFKVDIALAPGSHASESAVNKQLNDKERVAAALENPPLLQMVNQCLAGEAA